MHNITHKTNIPLSPPDKKLDIIESFSEVVYLLSIDVLRTDHGSMNF